MPMSGHYLELVSDSDANRRHWLDDLAVLVSSSRKISSIGGTVAGLGAVASFAWYSSPHGCFGWREPTLWDSNFVDIALERWIELQSGEVAPWTLLLFHMAHIHLHANLGLLQHIARLVARTSLRSSAGYVTAIEQWLTGRHYEISRYHAESILKIAKNTLGTEQRNFHCSKSGNFASHSQAVVPEPPHLPFCIYFATLVLWYGNLFPERDRLIHNAFLEAGAQILSGLHVRVAIYLRDALYELRIEEEYSDGMSMEDRTQSASSKKSSPSSLQ